MPSKILKTLTVNREMSVHALISALPDCQPCLERMIDAGEVRVTGSLRLRAK